MTLTNRILIALAFSLVALAPAAATAQNVTGDLLRLNTPTGPCIARAGVGTPEGVVAGNACDTYERKDTGQIYKKIGTGTTGWYPVLGPTAATCTTFAGCVAAQLTIDTTNFVQSLRVDPTRKLRTFVNADGSRIESYTAAGWAPLKLTGAPTRVMGGGFHVGGTNIIDPGLGNAQVDGFIGQPGFVSQTTGWRIDGLGAADFRYLFTDELHAKKFIADLEQALAGLQIIAKSVGQVGQAFTVPAAGAAATLVMKDLPSAEGMAVFESGDYVWIRTFSRAGGSLSIGNAFGIVTNYTDLADKLQSWTFTRLATNGGAMSGGTVVDVDSIVLDVGAPGNGWVETNAVDGLYGINAPYTQVVTWAGDSPIAANQNLRTRLGNLRGITGVTGEYGLIAGTYAASNGQYLRASSQAFELHGINLLMWDGATNVIKLDRTAPSFALGSPVPTAYATGTGLWMGKDGAAYKFRVGVPGGPGVFWDGTNLNISGSITVTGGNAAKTDFTNVTAGYAGSATVGGSANDTAAVNGVAAATVQSGSAKANLGLNASGVLVTKVIPASAVAPSGAGLYLGSDYLGYYSGSAWTTFMSNTGAFYLGGTSGALQWNGTTLTISGNLSGPGSGITSITGGNILTGTVTATQIASGTITATQIAAGTITADRLNVTSLSAISANLGTVTTGTISGPTAYFGNATLDSNGVTFTAGTGNSSRIKWSDGTFIQSNGVNGMSIDASATLHLLGESQLVLYAGTYVVSLESQGFFPDVGTINFGISTRPWATIYAQNLNLSGLSGTAFDDYPLVHSPTNSNVYYKTDGLNLTICGGGDVVETLTFERGIAVGYTCAPNPAPGMAPRPIMLSKGTNR